MTARGQEARAPVEHRETDLALLHEVHADVGRRRGVLQEIAPIERCVEGLAVGHADLLAAVRDSAVEALVLAEVAVLTGGTDQRRVGRGCPIDGLYARREDVDLVRAGTLLGHGSRWGAGE